MAAEDRNGIDPNRQSPFGWNVQGDPRAPSPHLPSPTTIDFDGVIIGEATVDEISMVLEADVVDTTMDKSVVARSGRVVFVEADENGNVQARVIKGPYRRGEITLSKKQKEDARLGHGVEEDLPDNVLRFSDRSKRRQKKQRRAYINKPMQRR